MRNLQYLSQLILERPPYALRLKLEREITYLDPYGHDAKVDLRREALAVELGEDEAVPLEVPWLRLKHKPTVTLSGEIEDEPPVVAGYLLEGGHPLVLPSRVSEIIEDGPWVDLERREEASNHEETTNGLAGCLHVNDQRTAPRHLRPQLVMHCQVER